MDEKHLEGANCTTVNIKYNKSHKTNKYNYSLKSNKYNKSHKSNKNTVIV